MDAKAKPSLETSHTKPMKMVSRGQSKHNHPGFTNITTGALSDRWQGFAFGAIGKYGIDRQGDIGWGVSNGKGGRQ